jgi:hypothetical protein
MQCNGWAEAGEIKLLMKSVAYTMNMHANIENHAGTISVKSAD